ncbi:hypothetical protein NDK47_13175 [Brevibacillus ruminantium]|uniref:Bacterial Ig-like domain-containing protein n=1 Tax=Brevibacillus ruminantium TaxID=2950604 RepID=A0ABY4WUA1_9BACL|nr:immunoglobulin-like domain-containing protein [Brevibacillus ruminantium]USG68171.1 hypothetical protein NDK47_13175 [Brevibacillus ruminantium]
MKVLKNLFGIILIVVLMAGCSHEEENRPLVVPSEYGELPQTISENGTHVDITITGLPDKSSNTKLNLEIHNMGSSRIEHGVGYALEKFEQGTWYVVPFKQDTTFVDIGLTLKPGDSFLEIVDLKDYDDQFFQGEYRIRKSVFVDNQEHVLAAKLPSSFLKEKKR